MKIHIVVTTDCNAVDEVRAFSSAKAALANVREIADELKARDAAHYRQITDHDGGAVVFAEDKHFSVEYFERRFER